MKGKTYFKNSLKMGHLHKEYPQNVDIYKKINQELNKIKGENFIEDTEDEYHSSAIKL